MASAFWEKHTRRMIDMEEKMELTELKAAKVMEIRVDCPDDLRL